MPKRNQNRAYKRGSPHRDARLFIIVAEGEREDAYFNWFNERNQRILIHMVPREGKASAPKHFLGRLEKFLLETDVQPGSDDSVWFVLDVDRWPRNAIDGLINACEQASNWQITLSNPCFEVWLHCHHSKPPEGLQTCKDYKSVVNTLFPGGFRLENACLLIDQAVVNSRDMDTMPLQAFPGKGQTKVYKLAEEMLKMLGQNWR